MNITITPTKLNGTVPAIASKSAAHRLLICAAFAQGETTLLCKQTNQDMEATAACLRALGADIQRLPDGYWVKASTQVPAQAVLPCGESGSTLRFMLPVVGALGVDATFLLEGRLPKRPLSPLWEEMERMGCHLSRPTENTIRCRGKLASGSYRVAGNVSSQFITGLLLSFALMDGNNEVLVEGKLESKPYVHMTLQALKHFGVTVNGLSVSGSLVSPGKLTVEGDWSNAAFFLGAKALGSDVTVTGLDESSAQGDKVCAELFSKMDAPLTVDCADIPDLVPILAVTAAGKAGATFTSISRLRLKESDRVASVMAMLKALGIESKSDEHTLTVFPGKITGGQVDACRDHRIAMAAAIAATVADAPVTILGAECTDKSYPTFWAEYRRIGGNYEQFLR